MLKFLIVDDDAVSQQFLSDILSPYGECHIVSDGKEAIESVRDSLENSEPYDLICLDILMPDINGHDALMAIRRLEADHNITGSDGVRVIMTTALRDSHHCLQAFREGCECYMSKPITAQDLLQQLHALGVLKQEEPAGSSRD